MILDPSLQGGTLSEARDPDSGEEEQECQHLIFGLDGQRFALPVTDVVQIIGLQDITPVPDYPDYAKGVINLRGMVVPVLDLRIRFHKQPRPYDARTCIIVTKILGQSFGLVADSVETVLDITPDQISLPPQVIAGGRENAYLSGVATVNDQLVLVMDSQKIISPEAAKEIVEQVSPKKEDGGESAAEEAQA